MTWLLLDQILRDMSEDLTGRHRSLACEFDIDPYEESHGYGFLWYDLAATFPEA